MNETLHGKSPVPAYLHGCRDRPQRVLNALQRPLIWHRMRHRNLNTEAEGVLEKLRRRSECRKFMRNHLIPRKGRSYSKDHGGLKRVRSDRSCKPRKGRSCTILQKAGIGETEAHDLLAEARITHNGQILKEIGIPAVSLKKYFAARDHQFRMSSVSTTPENLSAR